MPSTKPLLWISTFALLAACDSGSPIAPPQEPRPEAIASGPSCIAAHADTPCRLLTPELVKQEFWGLLMAHHIIRKIMAQAACSQAA